MLPCLAIASSVTSIGQQMIKTTARVVQEQFNATVVYGDTDSVMVCPCASRPPVLLLTCPCLSMLPFLSSSPSLSFSDLPSSLLMAARLRLLLGCHQELSSRETQSYHSVVSYP